MDFREKGQKDLRENLLRKLFDQYLFHIEHDGDTFKRIREKALCILSNALNAW
jgi:hypothetical protein